MRSVLVAQRGKYTAVPGAPLLRLRLRLVLPGAPWDPLRMQMAEQLCPASLAVLRWNSPHSLGLGSYVRLGGSFIPHSRLLSTLRFSAVRIAALSHRPSGANWTEPRFWSTFSWHRLSPFPACRQAASAPLPASPPAEGRRLSALSAERGARCW